MTQRPAPSSTSAWSGRGHGAVHCRHQRAVHNLGRTGGPQQAFRARCQAAARGTQQTLQAAPANLRHFGFASNFNDLYELGEHVGSGSFGAVHKATKRSTGERVAVKTIKKRVLGGYLEPHFVKRVQHEVDLYNHMGRSLNVAHLYGAYEDDKCVQLVLQLCTGGELWTRIKRGAYSEVQAARVIREVLRAVAQCHSRGVVVRDVKPENFLFLDDSADAPLKMVDFGMAEYCAEGQKLTDRAGTAIYCAPEVLRQRYGLKCDVWSAGIIAYQLLTARLPFITDEGDFLASDLRLSRARLSNRDIFSAILYAPLDFTSQPWPALSPAAKDFVQLLLTRDPEQRPTAAAALQHPWLALPQQQASTQRSPAGSTAAGHTPGEHADAPLLDDTLVQRLQRYGTYSKLKQVSLSKVASFMATYDPSTLAQLRAALDSASISGSNGSSSGGSGGAGEGPSAGSFKIPYHKMVEVLHSGQFALSEVEVRQLLSSFTIDADGCMDASEWLAALTDWQQVQDTDAWEQLVTNAFDAIDQDHSGQLNVPELEALLCGDEDGCPFDDVVPSALRGMQQDMLSSSGDDSRTTPAASSGNQQGSSTTQAQQSTATAGASDGKSPSPGPAPSGGAASSNGSSSSSGGRSGSPGDVVLDRPAFARLLRMAQQDRLELFESRRADAKPDSGSSSNSSSQAEDSTMGKDQ